LILSLIIGQSASVALAWPDVLSDPNLIPWGSFCDIDTAGEPPYDMNAGTDTDDDNPRWHTWTIIALNGA